MRIVRVEQLAPRGGALEVHPHLTVLRGVTPELLRRLRGVVDGIAGMAPLEERGLLEVSGVQLALEPGTLAQFGLDVVVDPVLELSRRATPAAQDAAGPREQLRAVTQARTELGAQMEAARAGLDSFSTAALEVCVGQIDALEARRAALRGEWERRRARDAERRGHAAAQLDALRALATRVDELDAAAVRSLREELAAATERPVEPDPDALELATRLDTSLGELRELVTRRSSLQLRESEAAQRLDEAAADAHAAERSLRMPQVDRAAVQRLEEVRDEIFAADDGGGGPRLHRGEHRMGGGRGKRRLTELRAEEAILLDRLGFDTYSSYVMGIPSLRAELERSGRVDAARAKADRIAEEIEQIRAEAPARGEVDDAARRLHELLGESLTYLGAPPDPRTPDGLARGVGAGDDSVDVVYGTVAALRRRRVLVEPELAARAPSLLAQLAQSLDDSLRGHPLVPAGPAELPSPPALPFLAVPHEVEPAEIVALSDEWLRWHHDVTHWLEQVRPAMQDLEQAIAELDEETDGDGGSAPIAEWAEVEGELDAALDRLADAQERVRRHEDATAQLAAMREQELELRDQERHLLESIAADAAANEAAAARGDTPTPRRPRSAAPTDRDPESLEWALVSRIAQQRSVSFVGSLPLLLIGLPDDDPVALRRLQLRLERLSDLVQVLVVDDRDDVADWAGGLGRGAAVVQL